MTTVTDCAGRTVKLPRALPYGWDRRDLKDSSFHSFVRPLGSATLRVMASGDGWEWSIEEWGGRLMERSFDDLVTATKAMRAAERAGRRLGFDLPSKAAR
jgi:hypothetical protein